MRWSRAITKSNLRGYKAEDWMLVYCTGFLVDGKVEVEPVTDLKPLTEGEAKWWLGNIASDRFNRLTAIQKCRVSFP